ncbi:hypothetical protein [Chryseobacterium sp. VD8]|uniref:hypothetical protein n=1 Tax=Chryseobacterium sp. VD8 TaxID=3081254 RepID=UPI0030197707
MNRIQVILAIDTNNLPENFQQILKHEQEVLADWKEKGILEHLFLTQTKDAAVIILKEVDEAKELIETLPLYQIKKSVEYLNLVKQF